MHLRNPARGLAVVVVLGCLATALAQVDYTSLQVDPRGTAEFADVVGGSKTGLVAAIAAAEKSGGGKAAGAQFKLVDGTLTISVEVVASGSHKLIEIDPATGKVLSTVDLPGTLLPGAAVSGEMVTTESGLQYYDLKVGTGGSPDPTSKVTVHYTGWLVNGKKFDSSVDRGQPATFPLNGVIRGWTEGVGSMKVGGKRKLIIPFELAYGPRGQRSIPPKATLIFDVELIEIVGQ